MVSASRNLEKLNILKKSEYIFGIRPIEEALEQGKVIEKLLFQKNLQGDASHRLLQKAKQHRVPVQQVPLVALNKITRKNHQGVIAYLSPIDYQNLDEIVMRTFEQGREPFIVILDHITDVRNTGAIARTAECAGVDALVQPAKGGALISGDAMKTSAGALMKIPVHRSFNLPETIRKLREYGIKIVACTEKTETLYTEVDYRGPLAIVMGSEDKGIDVQILKEVDDSASIPVLGEISSLNVSVANGIMLYEALRQRKS